MRFCFVYMKISLPRQYRTTFFDYEMMLLVVKRTVKQLSKVPLLKRFSEDSSTSILRLSWYLYLLHRQCYQCDILLKVGLSPSKKHCVIFFIESPLKLVGNVFLYYLKSSFHSQDVSVFATTFWSCRENGLIRLASQSGLQTIAIHILLNISQSKRKQTMKFGQLIEYNKINIFPQKLCRK